MHATEEPIITISGSYVRHESSDTPVDTFCRLVSDHSITGMRTEPIPDNVRWICERGEHAVYIVELKPELRKVRWSDNTDDTDDEALYNIATPYVIVKVPFKGRYTSNVVEVFYRNKPLQSLDDTLKLCNLRNIRRIVPEYPGQMCLCGLSCDLKSSREEILTAVINHLWSGLFNRHVGYAEDNFWHYQRYGKDERVKTIERWQQESLKDPEFVLGVQWLPSEKTVRDLIRCHFAMLFGGVAPTNCSQLGNLILKAS